MGIGLVTDLYELRMAESYLRRGMTREATFSLFVRAAPPGRGFLVAAGLDDALGLLEDFGYDEADLDFLADLGVAEGALTALADLRFTGDVWAVPEGRVVYPDEPLLEVTAPLPEAQLVETVLLNQLTFQTALATKAVRCVTAAAGRAAVIDFALRRTHGVDAGMAVARVACIAGFAGTSNVEAARRYDLSAVGTMAHSYVQAFHEEADAFRSFAADHRDHAILLVDTYDTLAGVDTAIAVADELRLGAGFGIRLDSGDLLGLSREARRRLDLAGYGQARIVVSGGLDEHDIARLLDAGAPIDVFGVGTKIGVAADAPSLDSAYKLVEYDGRPVMKLSAGKATRPGAKQVHRGPGAPDLLATRAERGPVGTTPLLVQVMAEGRRTDPADTVADAHARLASDLDSLTSDQLSLDAAPHDPIPVSPSLVELTTRTRTALTAPSITPV